MCTSKDKFKEYREYINQLIFTMDKIDNNENNELANATDITDISILKDILDIDVENMYFITKEHSDFKTRRHAILFFKYGKYIQFMNEIGLETNLRTDILRQE